MTKSETDFIDQYTRKLLVGWADLQARGTTSIEVGDHALYLEHAKTRGWVSKAAPHRVLSGGFTVATSFLKR